MKALITAGAVFCVVSHFAVAAPNNCPVDHAKLTQALKASIKPTGGPSNGGLDNHMWAAVIARDGTVCAVTRSGAPGEQWPGSRAIAIEKANTANAMSLPKLAISTANLYAGAQPGGPLYGITLTNPADPASLGAGLPMKWGTDQDPMVGRPASGVVVFGGGYALYDGKTIVGALGVSGDTSCGDSNIGWRVRHALGLDHVPGGMSPKHNDGILYDIGLTGKSSSGRGHPKCGFNEDKVAGQIGALGK